MTRLLTRHLLVSVSSLVAAVTLLPAGCLFGSSDCTLGESHCADASAALVCIGGEGSFHLSPEPCGPEKRCEVFGPQTAICVGSREGGSCVTHNGCLDQPLCIAGKCSPVPPAVVSACSAAVTLDVPTLQVAPDGATLDTTFEPGKAVVSAVIGLEPSEQNVQPCGAKTTGAERVITLNVPASPGNPEGVFLEVKVEGLDPKAVSSVAGFALESCADPRSLIGSACGQASNALTLKLPVSDVHVSVVSIVLQTTETLSKAVPFTLRAQLVSRSPK